MQQLLLVGEVATLGKELERATLTQSSSEYPMLSSEAKRGWGEFLDDDSVTTSAKGGSDDFVVNMDSRDPLTGSLKASEKAKLMQILGAWEEPDTFYDPSTVSAAYLLVR